MPLSVVQTLVDELLKFMDPNNPEFTGFPATPEEVGQRWSAAVQVWLSTGVLPPTLAAAATIGAPLMVQAMVAQAGGGDAYPPGVGPVALGNGMAQMVLPAAGPPAVPPPAVSVPPPALYVPPTLPPIVDPAVPAAAIAASLLAWALTGTFTPGTPTPPQPWA